jgi:hypothetical protein
MRSEPTAATENVDDVNSWEMRLAMVFERYATDLLSELHDIDAHEADAMINQSCGEDPVSRIAHAAASVPRADLVKVSDAFEFSKGATADRARSIVQSHILGSSMVGGGADRRKVGAYLTVLATLCVTWLELRDENSAAEKDIVLNVLTRIAGIQAQQRSGDDAPPAVDDDASQLPDDICALLKKLEDEGRETDDAEGESASGLGGGLDSMFESVMGGDSSIGNIAREVAKDIDISRFAEMLAPKVGDGADPDAPPAMPDIGSLLQNNGIIGEIVSSVSSKISQKMANGELDQNALMSEAMGLMSSLGGGGNKKKGGKKGGAHGARNNKQPDLGMLGSLLGGGGGGGGGMPPGMADIMAKMMQSFTPGRV